MTAESKLEVLWAVQGTGLPVKRVLSQLGIARSIGYRWRQISGSGAKQITNGPYYDRSLTASPHL